MVMKMKVVALLHVELVECEKLRLRKFKKLSVASVSYLLHSGTHNLSYIPQLCLLHIMQELRQLQVEEPVVPLPVSRKHSKMHNSQNFQRNQLKLTLLRRSGGGIQRKRRKQLT